jgi:hypothetical protein
VPRTLTAFYRVDEWLAYFDDERVDRFGGRRRLGLVHDASRNMPRLAGVVCLSFSVALFDAEASLHNRAVFIAEMRMRRCARLRRPFDAQKDEPLFGQSRHSGFAMW